MIPRILHSDGFHLSEFHLILINICLAHHKLCKERIAVPWELSMMMSLQNLIMTLVSHQSGKEL